jgi:hypothetical protein
MSALPKSRGFSRKKLLGCRDVYKETKVFVDLANKLSRGDATMEMLRNAVAMADKQILFWRRLGDHVMVASTEKVRDDFAERLRSGDLSATPRKADNDELILVEMPIFEARTRRGHEVRRQVQCKAGRADIFDVTAHELIECKMRGSVKLIAEAAGQLKKYEPCFDRPELTIAVPEIEPEAAWVADLLRSVGFTFLQVKKALYI